jgi:hypothetical protein
MNPREIFDYKCSTCKRMGEPGDFGNNERTGAKLKTCKICRRKRLERENAFRERQIAFNNVFIPAGTQMPDPTDLTSTDGLGPNPIVRIPVSSSEIEPTCANACVDRSTCLYVISRYTCGHFQCRRVHGAIGCCIVCSCDTLRDTPSQSSSGPREAAQPEAEPEPEETPERVGS